MRKLILAALLTPSLLVACSNGPSEAERQAQALAAQQHRLAEEAEHARLVEAQRVRNNIEAVLTADAATGAISEVAARAAAMRAIDLSGCPGDFSKAYVDHTYAWERAAAVRQAIAELNSDDAQTATLAASVISAVFDLGQTPIADHLRAEQRLSALNDRVDGEIAATFHEVKRLAAGYGARLPS